jgi:hypothetical protein
MQAARDRFQLLTDDVVRIVALVVHDRLADKPVKSGAKSLALEPHLSTLE